ncbi:Alpha/beta hydrolase [Sinosporangium album]|uniref:Alpha/beta hydrolase n=1 Tax=Sinosporangium album TaxID=504805 RepID=A0A1G8DZV1_9ACTN|nr:alpha/beta hydrolase [Sinosporangium album]SDH63101.1 Alpha/beta hydrolase [Sinosporangium album]
MTGRTMVSVAAVVAAVGGLLGSPQAAPVEKLVRVYGDLATAEHVAVVVPGSDTTVATFERRGDKPYSTPEGGAKALMAEARRVDPAAKLAVVAWLGYDSPKTWSLGVATAHAAEEGARALRGVVDNLEGKRVTLLCHSYGSVVCAKAVPGSAVADLAVFGSAGLQVGHARDLGGVRLWAGLGADDWISNVPNVTIGPFGFGADPMHPDFGARRFTTGRAGHSDYLRPESESLRNLTLIALGRASEVTVVR